MVVIKGDSRSLHSNSILGISETQGYHFGDLTRSKAFNLFGGLHWVLLFMETTMSASKGVYRVCRGHVGMCRSFVTRYGN